MAPRTYDTSFMQLAAQSRQSAEQIIPLVLEQLPIESIADFGCALGTWLSVWRSRGVQDILGIDGEYVRGQDIEIGIDSLIFRDFSEPFFLGRRFDLVQSLEVAEHLPPHAAASFVETLVRHSDYVLFSAAPPGQGGAHHINEQPYEHWRHLFAKHDFIMSDWIRPQIAADPTIRYWYRYNMFMFVKRAALDRASVQIKSAQIPPEQPVKDVSPMLFKVRKRLVRNLPQSLQTEIANKLAELRTR